MNLLSFSLSNKKINKSSTFIYLISNNNNSIKIGHSKNPLKRIKQLQTGNDNKLTLLLVCYADIYLEKRLHKMFLFHKKYGEWFTVSTEQLNFIIQYLLERYDTQLFI